MPSELMAGPFTLADAERAGLSRWHLEGASWRRLGPSVYTWSGLSDTPELNIQAARRRLPPAAVFSGLTAAWLHGLDVGACEPIEVIIPKGFGVSGRTGIVIRRAALAPEEIVSVRGMQVTSLLRTLGDLAMHLTVTEAVVVVDMALHARRATLTDLNALAAARANGRGVAQLRRVARFAEPAAESPMESRLRMVLLLGRLPRPIAQFSLHDQQGRFLGRPDLYYPDHRLGLEYDGGTHRSSLVEDNRRQNRLLASGVRLLRFTAADVLHSPESVVAQVRTIVGRGPARAGTRGPREEQKHVGAGTRVFRIRSSATDR